jgi:hypothetical protein
VPQEKYRRPRVNINFRYILPNDPESQRGQQTFFKYMVCGDEHDADWNITAPSWTYSEIIRKSQAGVETNIASLLTKGTNKAISKRGPDTDETLLNNQAVVQINGESHPTAESVADTDGSTCGSDPAPKPSDDYDEDDDKAADAARTTRRDISAPSSECGEGYNKKKPRVEASGILQFFGSSSSVASSRRHEIPSIERTTVDTSRGPEHMIKTKSTGEAAGPCLDEPGDGWSCLQCT